MEKGLQVGGLQGLPSSASTQGMTASYLSAHSFIQQSYRTVHSGDSREHRRHVLCPRTCHSGGQRQVSVNFTVVCSEKLLATSVLHPWRMEQPLGAFLSARGRGRRRLGPHTRIPVPSVCLAAWFRGQDVPSTPFPSPGLLS
jgi:hypothetical protein